MNDAASVASVLADVIDPELGIGIVDLGLIYAIQRDADDLHVEMTTTTPLCPMGGVLFEAAASALARAFPAARLDLVAVDDPQWDVGMLSPRARMILGLPPV